MKRFGFTKAEVVYNRIVGNPDSWRPCRVYDLGKDAVEVQFRDEHKRQYSFVIAFGERPKGTYLHETPPVEFAAAKDLVREVFPGAKPVEARRNIWSG